MGTHSLRRRRVNLWNKENGKCFWCGCDTILPPQGISSRTKREIPDNEATIDHLRTRFDENRQEPGNGQETRTVLSCRKCNNDRGKEREMQVPIEERKRRSQLGRREDRKNDGQNQQLLP